MGGAPYIGPRLGGGPIFEVSVSHLYAKERPGKLPTLILLISALFKHGYQFRTRAAAILHRVLLSAALLSGRGYDR